MIVRSTQNLDCKFFRNPLPVEVVGQIELDKPPDRQYVLRMMIHHPVWGWCIPADLNWIRPMIDQAKMYQQRNFGCFKSRFIYVTVRHGIVTSQTEDVWHVDGYSIRVPHVPEQNYIWFDSNPMETCDLPITVPPDFDGLRHNLHWFLQDKIPLDYKPVVVPEKTTVVFDPYHIHRRPPETTGQQRTMVRISFVPIQIESDDCQQNPGFPVQTFNRSDVRDKLTRYQRHVLLNS